MKRICSLLVVAVFACGGSTPTPTTTPLPPEPEDAKPAEVEKPAPAPTPPAPRSIDFSIAAPKTTLKLVKPGTGKKAVLKLATTQGAKQHVEVTLDFSGTQDGDAATGSSKDMTPTVVIASDVEVGDVGADGATKFTMTVTGEDAKDRPGAKASADQFKADIAGMTVAGSVSANGQLGALAVHLEKADEKAATVVALLKLLMTPLWPQLPTDPIGVGAKWTVSSPIKIAERFNATQTVEFELVSHKGNAWAINGSVKLVGDQQKPDPRTIIDKISRTGTIAMSLSDGALVPQSTTSSNAEFTATVTFPPGSGQYAGQTHGAVPPRPGLRRRADADGRPRNSRRRASSARSLPMRSRIARRASSVPTIHAWRPSWSTQPVTHSKPSQSTSNSAEPSSCIVTSPTGQVAPIRVTASGIELDAHRHGIRARHVEPLAPVGLEIEVGGPVELLAGRAQRRDPIDAKRADVPALVTEPDDVPLAGVMHDAVGIDRPALVAVTRRRDVVDLEPLALASCSDQRAQMTRDGGLGRRRNRRDDRRGRELGLVRIAAERGEQLLLGRLVASSNGAMPLSRSANAEQQRAALGGGQAQRPRQPMPIDEHPALVDRDQQILARIAVGRTDLGRRSRSASSSSRSVPIIFAS